MDDIEYYLHQGISMIVIHQEPGDLIIYRENVPHFVLSYPGTLKISTNFISKYTSIQ
jgi:hypothetical protein